MWIVSLYIGLQAVFIIFHYSCCMHDCARRAVISAVGVEANQGLERFLNSDMQTVQQNHKCHDLFSRLNISRKELKKISYESGTKTSHKTYSQYLFSDLQEPTVPAGIEVSPHLKFLHLVFNANPCETTCYYGEGAARFTSKPSGAFYTAQVFTSKKHFCCS